MASKSFATLMRNSQFIKQGDFRGANIIGKIFHITDDDLYVDVGLKFHTVVKRPQKDARLYVRGATVSLKFLSYEITDRFIGSEQATSLLEADAILLGLESSPVGSKQGQKKSSN